MMCAGGMLCSYASAMEMAFAANLLFTAVASIYNFQWDRQRKLAIEADALAKNPAIQEEVSIQVLQNVITGWGQCRNVLWRIIRGVCLIAALYLYILMWHVSPDTRIDDGWWWWNSLMVAAYAGPISMILMPITGMVGVKHASFWTKKLQKQARINQAASEKKLREAAKRIPRRASRRPPLASN